MKSVIVLLQHIRDAFDRILAYSRHGEVMVADGKARLIRRRETYEDVIRGYVDGSEL